MVSFCLQATVAFVIYLLHLVGVGVGSDLLSSHTSNDIDVAAVVLHALLGAAAGALLLLLCLYLRRLVSNLTCASERAVNLSHPDKSTEVSKKGKNGYVRITSDEQRLAYEIIK